MTETRSALATDKAFCEAGNMKYDEYFGTSDNEMDIGFFEKSIRPIQTEPTSFIIGGLTCVTGEILFSKSLHNDIGRQAYRVLDKGYAIGYPYPTFIEDSNQSVNCLFHIFKHQTVDPILNESHSNESALNNEEFTLDYLKYLEVVDVDKSLMYLYNGFFKLLSKSNFDDCDKVIANLLLRGFTLQTYIGVLTITLKYKSELKNRGLIFNEANKIAHSKYNKRQIKSILGGLQ